MKPFYSISEIGVTVELHVQPGASKSEWAGLFGERLKVRIAGKAVDGQANETLIAFISKFFNTPKSQVNIRRGEKSREKTILICGDTNRIATQLDALVTAHEDA